MEAPWLGSTFEENWQVGAAGAGVRDGERQRIGGLVGLGHALCACWVSFCFCWIPSRARAHR